MPFPISSDKIETRHYINGVFSPSSDEKTFPIYSPYNREKITDVSEASVSDTNRAVEAARKAFPSWSSLDPPSRGGYMKKFATLIRGAATELAQLDAMAMGRPVSSYFDPYYVAGLFEHYAEAGYDAKGTTSLNTPGFVNITLKQPIGPVAAIIPWNAPTIMFGYKLAPALAAGCTVVLKSSEKAPLSPAKLATLVHEAGFPPGVVNVLSGHGTPCGATLSSHMDIRMINFTGSTATGRKIQEAAAKSNLKRVVLELGGKTPVIIFPDADIEKAAAETAASLHLLMGQVCAANSRIYIHESIFDQFKTAFLATYTATKLGDPLDPTTTQGPQADTAQHNRIKHYLSLASNTPNAILETGGHATTHNPNNTTSNTTQGPAETGTGLFIEPTIYTSLPASSPPMTDEVFGPFATLTPFTTETAALSLANASEYGLYAAVYSADISRALRVAKALEAGSVGVNCTSPTQAVDMPFGGWKGSGEGREGYGWAMEACLETKAVFVKLEGAGDPIALRVGGEQ